MDNKVVSLDAWRRLGNIEEDYLKYLTHVNKYLTIPTTVPDLIRSFYFNLRYLEGTVNALDVLSLVKQLPEKEVEQLKFHVIEYLDELKSQLMKF